MDIPRRLFGEVRLLAEVGEDAVRLPQGKPDRDRNRRRRPEALPDCSPDVSRRITALVEFGMA